MNRPVTTALVAMTLVLSISSTLFATEINLFAAASLREVLNELSDSYARKHPGVVFRKNYGASGTLAKQIENGAPADIFISANTEWLDYLKARKLTDEKRSDIFAYNVLVFAGKPALKVSRLQDVVMLEKIAIGSPKSVPAGEYAMAALRKAGLDRQLGNKLVMARDVRECLMYADRGEVDGAFVYKTDALQVAKRVKTFFEVPQEYYPRVTYPMTLTRQGVKKGDAAAFFAMLQSAEAKAVLGKHGFIRVPMHTSP
jgi:molybdate transport system substrate-binding protein